MTKLVVLRLDEGNLGVGFLATLRIGEYGTPPFVEVSGRLPPFPELIELSEHWQSAYSTLEFCWRSLRKKPQKSTSIIGIDKFKELSCKLEEILNDWLNSQEFRSIKDEFLRQLSRSEEIRVLIQTEDIQVRRLPWHLWDIFEYYPKAEVAFGESTYTRIHHPSSSTLKGKVRILAVLGNSHGINLQKDQELLVNLPDADIRFLVGPSRRELDRELWEEPGWDILFFAGHSYSKTDGKTGHLCINSTQTLPISQLKNALKASIERGLQIAIFNSCDGLGIARNLADLHIPQVICMREPVPDIIAHEFLLHFIKSFSIGKSLYISVREAREKLQGLEDDFPCASWLPVIFQNLGESPPTWQELCPMSLVTQQQNEDCNLYTKRVEAWNKCREKNLELVPDFKGINLSGVNLAGANLSRVNLSGANLAEANLSGANLSEANLTRANLTAVQALNTNFENALLTGACIQDWNINKETKLDGIICSYVYLRGSQQERRPSSGNFALGDFAHLVQKVVEAIELIFRNGIDFKAFACSLKKLQVENEDTQLDVQSLENKGDGLVIVRLSVSSEADKAKIHSEFIQSYELAKEALEAQYQARLEDKEKYINQLVSFLNESQNRLTEMSNLKSETSTYNMRNVNISNFVSGSMQGSHIGDNQYNYAPEHKQTLAEAAAEIQQLLEQLDKSYPTNTTAGKMAVASEAIQHIESNPTLKERILSALKAGGISALETLLLHPAASFVISALEDWQKDKKFY
jgi:uncharacterized protein YjbI with pentapeptide repeats